MSPEVSNAVKLICELHKADGAVPIGRMKELWYRKLDDHWQFWINGQIKDMPNEDGVPVSPGDVYVKFNGWPAGSFSMITGDGILAAGTLANYDTFCEALRAAIAKRTAA